MKFIWMVVFLSHSILAADVVGGLDFIRRYSAGDDFKSWYQGSNWYTLAVFDDLDGDGIVDALISLPIDEQRGDNREWRFVRQNKNGVLKEVVAKDRKWGLFCSKLHLLWLDRGGRQQLLLMESKRHADMKGNQMLPVFSRIGIDAYQYPEVVTMFNGIGALLDCDGFGGLRAVNPVLYKGFEINEIKGGPINSLEKEFKLPSRDWCLNVARQYRKDVEKVLGDIENFTASAIFFDMDGDGDVDAYVTSSIEQTTEGTYRWQLFLNEGGNLVKCDGKHAYEDSRGNEMVLDGMVTVGKKDFYGVVQESGNRFLYIDNRTRRNSLGTVIAWDFVGLRRIHCIEFVERNGTDVMLKEGTR